MDRQLVVKDGVRYYEMAEEKMNESFSMEVLTSEDAQLQARIWNRFLKKRDLTQEQGEYFITPTVFNDLVPRQESQALAGTTDGSVSAVSGTDTC